MVKHGEPFRGSGIEESLDCCGGCETIVTRTFGRVFLEMSLLLLLHKNLVAEGQFRDVDEIASVRKPWLFRSLSKALTL